LIFVLFLALLVGVGALVFWGQYSRRTAELYYSGTIEATESNLAFQVSGRVKAVLTDEGRSIAPGEVLAVLDADEFKARREQAAANLTSAQEGLRQAETALEVNRQVLPAQVEQAEANVKALQAQLKEYESGYRVQDVERARLAAESGRETYETARRNKARYDELYQRGVVAERTKDSIDLQYQTALKDYESALEAYRQLKEGFRREDVDAARSRLAEGLAALRLARSNLMKIDASAQEVEAAKAQVEAARATLEVAAVQLAHTELRAPYAGIVLSRNVEPGEVVSPGQEVLSVADLSTVDLKIFVDETEIGKVRPGQTAEVRIDTFPDKAYSGRVAYVSPQAEFTPKIIQTHKERVKLVYLVKIEIENPNFELKTGMPADAWLR
jgi:HlyD family secretion protein